MTQNMQPNLEDVAAQIANADTNPTVDTQPEDRFNVGFEKLEPDVPTQVPAEGDPDVQNYKDAVQKFEEAQEINNALLDIPDELIIADRVIAIKSKTLRQLGRINKAVLIMNQVNVKETSLDPESDDFWDELLRVQDESIEAMTDCLFCIINPDYENPDFDREWIQDNVDVSDDGEGCEIVEMFNRRNTASRFLSLILQSRKV